MSPNQSPVTPLVPEFVTPQDGNDKQDGEPNASRRWMDQESEHFSAHEITVLGDDLYCKGYLEYFDERYRLVREELGARKIFFDDVRALTRYIGFDSWHHLLETMMEGLEIPIPPS